MKRFFEATPTEPENNATMDASLRQENPRSSSSSHTHSSPRNFSSSESSPRLSSSPRLEPRYSQSPPETKIMHSIFAQQALAWERTTPRTRSTIEDKEVYMGNPRVYNEKVRAYIRDLLKNPLHNDSEINVVSRHYHVIANDTRYTATVYRPNQTPIGDFPTIFYIGGTAWTARSNPDLVPRRLAHYANMQVINIEHRLAPEHIFPTPIVDCHEQIKVLLKDHRDMDLDIDVDNLFLAGYCSGGTIAILLALQAQEDNIDYRSVFLFSPMTDFSRTLNEATFHCPVNDTHRTATYKLPQARFISPQLNNKKQKADSIISEEFVEHNRAAYVPNTGIPIPGKMSLPLGDMRYKNPVLSPVFKSVTELQTMPPTVFWVNTVDRFYNDTMAMAARLQAVHGDEHIQLIEWDSEYGHGALWQDPQMGKLVGVMICERYQGYVAKLQEQRELLADESDDNAISSDNEEDMLPFAMQDIPSASSRLTTTGGSHSSPPSQSSSLEMDSSPTSSQNAHGYSTRSSGRSNYG